MTIDTLGSLSPARTDRGYATEVATVSAGRATVASSTANQTGTAASTTATATATTTATATNTGSMDELKDAVGKLNKSVHAQSLEFSIDQDSKRTIVKVVDVATKEIVRQMPTEEALQIAKSLDKAMGLLIRQQA
ncbi:MAG TPA: flagellar protein FlaG [Pseudoduganella sp.]